MWMLTPQRTLVMQRRRLIENVYHTSFVVLERNIYGCIYDTFVRCLTVTNGKIEKRLARVLLWFVVRVSVVPDRNDTLTFLLSKMRLRHTVLLESDLGRNTWKKVRHRRRTDNAHNQHRNLPNCF